MHVSYLAQLIVCAKFDNLWHIPTQDCLSYNKIVHFFIFINLWLINYMPIGIHFYWLIILYTLTSTQTFFFQILYYLF